MLQTGVLRREVWLTGLTSHGRFVPAGPATRSDEQRLGSSQDRKTNREVVQGLDVLSSAKLRCSDDFSD
ncbi:unnamed protein product [Protopolystoma xenopodis]|uniref:Uncharacterized protein n=1 Tax=Protopolystoma xenopodis TaxID=117903 RepID=A0A448XM73_9PLAT|nr:unnamed protein product [Protopolystoma xenopodis]